MAELRKYGEATTLVFPLIDAGAQDFETTPVTHASGDTKIIKDEGVSANTTNAFAHEGEGIYSLALTATEMQAARIVVTIKDQGTKAWEDQAIIIETYGHASSQHPGLSFEIAEPSAVPSFTSLPGEILSWILALSRNKMTSTSTTTTLRNDADTANLATFSNSDDGTTFTSGEAT